MSWAFEQKDLTPSEKLVLLALADHANDDGRCWPGQEHLANKCCMLRENVNRILKSLEKKRLIISQRKRDETGRDIGKIYNFCTPGVSPAHRECITSAQGSVSPAHTNHQLEPSIESSYMAKKELSPIKEFLDYANSTFLEKYKSPLSIQWGKDSAIIKSLMAIYSMDKLITLWTQFLALADIDEFIKNKAGVSIGVFKASINKLVTRNNMSLRGNGVVL